jgi:Multimeric flavodoxin WrbA
MKALIIADNDYQTDIFEKLRELTISFLKRKGFEMEFCSIDREDLTFCMGCFGCWIKKPGECVINDMMAEINRTYNNSDLVIYLSPIIFGQPSANIKNAIDRWLPNLLPFFETRSDKSTMHPSRYGLDPRRIIIGYGDSVSEEDKLLFCDIIKKHQNNFEALIYQNNDNDLIQSLETIKYSQAGGQL